MPKLRDDDLVVQGIPFTTEPSWNEHNERQLIDHRTVGHGADRLGYIDCEETGGFAQRRRAIYGVAYALPEQDTVLVWGKSSSAPRTFH